MDKQMATHHREGSRRRSHRRLRTLFLSGGLMAALAAAGPAVAKVDKGPPAPSQQEKKKPAPKDACIKGPRQNRVISHKVRFLPDQSYARVTWEPRFCRQGGEWTTTSKPTVVPLGASEPLGVKIQLEDSPQLIRDGVRYRAFLRSCDTLGVGKVSFETCPRLGTATFSARVVGKGRVRYGYEMKTEGLVKKIGGGKLEWTDKVL
jgi:hypothetical protein